MVFFSFCQVGWRPELRSYSAKFMSTVVWLPDSRLKYQAITMQQRGGK
jgi:hypothetical protein